MKSDVLRLISILLFLVFSYTHQSLANTEMVQEIDTSDIDLDVELNFPSVRGFVNSIYFSLLRDLGIEVEDPSVVSEFLSSAKSGDPDAQLILGTYYLYEKIDGNFIRNAIKWFKKSAKQGHSDAQFILCLMQDEYYDPVLDTVLAKPKVTYLAPDYSERINSKSSMESCLQSARNGNPVAMYNIAMRYLNGRGVAKNLDQFKVWISKSAKGELALAQSVLGSSYLRGKIFQRNIPEALHWLKLASGAGNASAQFNLGKYYYGNKDFDNAFKLTFQSAMSGDKKAQNALAYLYLKGEGVKRDMQKSAEWVEKAAKNGHPRAQSKYSSNLSLGKYTNKNETAAFSWALKSAKQGDLLGQFLLASYYYRGIGTKKSHRESLYWLKKPVLNQFISSYVMFSAFYIDGKLIPRDFVKAYVLLEIASKEIISAEKIKNGFIHRLTNKQFGKVQKILNGDENLHELVKGWMNSLH